MGIGKINTVNPFLVVGNINVTDQYHISSARLPHAVVKDIVYPFTVGRDFMKIGAEHDDDSSLTVVFQSEGEHENIIYAQTYQQLWDSVLSLGAFLKNNPITTVSCYLFQIQKARVQIDFQGAPITRGIIGHAWPFVLTVSQYS